MRQTGVCSSGGDADARRRVLSFDRDHDDAAARNRRAGDQAQVEHQLDLVLRQQDARGVPDDLRAVVGDQVARHRLRVARVDRRAGGARGPEGEAAELQPGGGRLGALLDKLGGEGAHFGVLLVFEHFEPVDDRANRADHVVADARAEKRGQIESVERENGARRGLLPAVAVEELGGCGKRGVGARHGRRPWLEPQARLGFQLTRGETSPTVPPSANQRSRETDRFIAERRSKARSAVARVETRVPRPS